MLFELIYTIVVRTYIHYRCSNLYTLLLFELIYTIVFRIYIHSKMFCCFLRNRKSDILCTNNYQILIIYLLNDELYIRIHKLNDFFFVKIKKIIIKVFQGYFRSIFCPRDFTFKIILSKRVFCRIFNPIFVNSTFSKGIFNNFYLQNKKIPYL